MREGSEIPVDVLAAHVGGQVIGDGSILIQRVAGLESARKGAITYVEDEKFFEAASQTKASCVLVPEGADVKAPCRLEVKKPKLAFALIAEILHPPKKRVPEIHSSSVIAADAKIGKDVFIGAFVCIGENSSVGDGTQIRAGAKIGDNVSVGRDCIIHPNVFFEDGVTIGDDCVIGGQVGFGDHIRVQSGAVIGSKAGILPGKIVRPGVWWGIPIQPLDEYKRLNAHIQRLPQVREEVKELRQRVKELESVLMQNRET